MAQMSHRGGSLFCWLFIVIGLVAVGAGAWTLIKSVRTEHWPVTDGVIQSSHQEAHSDNDGTTYSAEVTYAYQVFGVSYDGGKISIGQMSSSSQYAQKILARYPVGKKVSVHYSPANPAEAVLETGIHGGTWICFGVGTAFALFGAMFLQIQRAAAEAQMPGAQPSSVRTNPDGSISTDKPPVLMGVIFLLAGVGICFATPDGHAPKWILVTVGLMFAVAGLLLLLMRLENKVYSKIATWVMLAMFLVVFHWISFGPGDRTGTATTPFSISHVANMRTPFALFTILLDVLIVGGLIHSLFKRRKD